MSHSRYILTSKSGLSALISIVLIIGLVIALSTLVFYWSTRLVKGATEETSKTAEKSIKCFNDVELVILDVCYDTKIHISLENKKDAEINGNFLLIKVEGENDVSIQPTPPGVNILPFEKRKIAVTYFPEIGKLKKISIIPRLLGDKGPIFCTENLAESTIIKETCS